MKPEQETAEQILDRIRKKTRKSSSKDDTKKNSDKDDDIARLNAAHAVLPIGGKTKVVTFGELPDFPGRETIVMTQTFGDFAGLQNKYRHEYVTDKGRTKSVPLGTYWLSSKQRRQYDGGMAFMPRIDAKVVGKKLNLWNGYGVQAIKPSGKSGAAGCKKFLDFAFEVICSSNENDFDYLIKREAFILQKRVRSEIALGMNSKQEGVGKGFYERHIGRLYGNHALQVSNPAHVIGKFNPHLETLLRLTADEALFVGNHEHRNALFGLVTEPKLTIEPKFAGVYTADSYLNITITSNAEHFIPVSGTARRFFVPTVSPNHLQDLEYFGGIEDQLLKQGGAEALLFHLLHEINLTDFDVRKVPRTIGLLEQRDQSLEPLESWWVELLETGILEGADPVHPNCAVSNEHEREIKIKSSGYDARFRHVKQKGVYDQARNVEPRLKRASDHILGRFLKEQKCISLKVLRRRGWKFPDLAEARSAWEARFPDWKWRDSTVTEWTCENDDDE